MYIVLHLLFLSSLLHCFFRSLLPPSIPPLSLFSPLHSLLSLSLSSLPPSLPSTPSLSPPPSLSSPSLSPSQRTTHYPDPTHITQVIPSPTHPIPTPQRDVAAMDGLLYKRGKIVRNWKSRYFVLDPEKREVWPMYYE